MTPSKFVDEEQKQFIANTILSNNKRETQAGNTANLEIYMDFTLEEGNDLLAHAKSGKAPGIDGLLD